MDRDGINYALIQQTNGKATMSLVALTVRKHPDRFFGLIRIGGHDEPAAELADRRPDNMPSEEALATNRARAAREVARGVEELGLIGVGEFFVRRFTMQTHPERIALDMKPFMDVIAKYKIPIQIHTAWTQYPHNLFYHNPIWTDEIGADRIMFGTDWSPTWRWVTKPTDYYTMRKGVLDKANLTESERE